MAEHAETANRIRMLGSFDPEIPKAFSDLQEARAAGKGAPTPIPGESAKIGPKEVRGAKTEALQARADTVRAGGRRLASYGVGLKALWDTFHGNFEGVGSDVAIGLAGYKFADLAASALEKSSVVDFLTKPTVADIAQIPPELRGQFPAILKAAKAKGIRVDPRITAVLGITALNGAKAKKLQEISDQYRSQAVQ
jgi:hypothetical protein